METVKRISPLVRSAARYETSLEVLRQIAESGTTTKSGIMVGLGETPDEVEELMDDLRNANCQILTIGQYLQPTHKHYAVAEYITPAQFAIYKELWIKERVHTSGKCTIGSFILPCRKIDPISTKKDEIKNISHKPFVKKKTAK